MLCECRDMKNLKFWCALVLVALLGVCLPILAFASPDAAQTAAEVATSGLETPDPSGAVASVTDALERGATSAAWLAGLILLVASVRKWGPKFWPVLGSGTVAVGLTCLAGVLSGIVPEIAAGAAAKDLVLAAGAGLWAGLAASGLVRGAQMAAKPAEAKPDVPAV